MSLKQPSEAFRNLLAGLGEPIAKGKAYVAKAPPKPKLYDVAPEPLKIIADRLENKPLEPWFYDAIVTFKGDVHCSSCNTTFPSHQLDEVFARRQKRLPSGKKDLLASAVYVPMRTVRSEALPALPRIVEQWPLMEVSSCPYCPEATTQPPTRIIPMHEEEFARCHLNHLNLSSDESIASLTLLTGDSGLMRLETSYESSIMMTKDMQVLTTVTREDGTQDLSLRYSMTHTAKVENPTQS